jgi:hypothetical protein
MKDFFFKQKKVNLEKQSAQVQAMKEKFNVDGTSAPKKK